MGQSKVLSENERLVIEDLPYKSKAASAAIVLKTQMRVMMAIRSLSNYFLRNLESKSHLFFAILIWVLGLGVLGVFLVYSHL